MPRAVKILFVFLLNMIFFRKLNLETSHYYEETEILCIFKHFCQRAEKISPNFPKWESTIKSGESNKFKKKKENMLINLDLFGILFGSSMT